MELLDFFSRANADYIDQLYQQYQRDPHSVDERWAVFFAGFEAGGARGSVLESLLSSQSGSPAEGVNHLVHSYRELGHFTANLNPLGGNRESHPLLDLSEFGFSAPADLPRQVGNGGFLGPYDGTLGGLLESLKTTYCGTLGVEYTDIADKKQRLWLQERMEPALNRPELSPEEKRRVLEALVAAEGFEQYLHTKYVGVKRFSLQGSESVIPMLETILGTAGESGVTELVMGMAHRGRLNVLAHTLQKPYELILSEFEGTALPTDDEGDGDVKYHLGYSNERALTAGQKIRVTLSPNPSHLEIVNPVVEGLVKAGQDRLGDADGARVIPVLIHGEAAFTGQGVVPETLSLSELDAYRTGGTIHLIINNQVGFTAIAKETRFTPYPTDVAKMIQAPIFHVNADDPEAVVHAARLAVQFRQEFKVDVMIDLWGYRKYGHNETDDPSFTQPLMYQIVDKKVSVRDQYAAKLVAEGVVTEADVDHMKSALKERLDAAQAAAKKTVPRDRYPAFRGAWEGFTRAREDWSAKTAISADAIARLTASATRVPDDFTVHPKLKKLLATREEMGRGERGADWGTAEMWAIGSLLLEGTPVRLMGQDSERGTFSHRHAVLHDYQNGAKYAPLQHLSPDQARFTIANTMLSELAVLGFEYGYSAADPRNLVMWEAQFGDFANGAQAVFDQFLSSAESKWDHMNGLTLLLPHGYEGQGPEHSSARLERFLQLCAENNMQVCYPTLPAQYFHLLRRQMRRNFRKPLVLMMPKSLLRDERSSSRLEEFTESGFASVIDDPTVTAPETVRRVLLCTGKVYFTLVAGRAERKTTDTALVRVEQLYPFPKAEIEKALGRYQRAEELYWVQEEPRNMGAWTFMEPRLGSLLPSGLRLEYCGRGEAASPAHGFYRIHHLEEHEFVARALETGQQQATRPPLKEQRGH
jgi:2-oxoglutarate dehydrogenase E1 component